MSRAASVCTDCGTTDEIHHHNCATHERGDGMSEQGESAGKAAAYHRWLHGEERIDRIAQSDASGDHYADPVNHPDHYQSADGIECIDAIRAALGLEGFVAHCRGTAIKYAWRSGKKAAHAEDLRKACVYLEWAAKALEEGEQ